jgi:uncharacterized phage protein (TIGR01671 family)
MSRAIKFRAWAAYGEMLTNIQNHIGNGPWAFGTMLTKPDEFSIMQFTGLTDINGVEIYEGDIVSVAGHGNCEVKITSYLGVVYVDTDGYEATHYDCADELDYPTVIGNIYQNPELLK